MQVSTSVSIEQPIDVVWQAITDIENAQDMISSIDNIEVLENPAAGLVGFKWRETRQIFGKPATETMWITQAVENQFYCTRAESHGAIYKSKLALTEANNSTILTMSFSSQADSVMAKFMSLIMGYFMKNFMKKELDKDLHDIKQFLEARK